MIEHPLYSEYKKLCPDIRKVYVVHKINFSCTDGVYLLYRDFLEKESAYHLQIKSIWVSTHYQMILSRFRKENSLVHYHWVEVTDFKSFAGMFWKLFCISVFKLLGGKLVWTVHNKFPHTRSFKSLNRIIRIYFAFLADKLHVHCRSAISIMTPILKAEPDKFFVVNHPEYPVKVYPKSEAFEILRDKFYVNKDWQQGKLFLMFGAIADYKGIVHAAELFKNYFRNLNLIIAGPVKRWDGDYLNKVSKASESSPNILLIPRRIPDDFVPAFLNAADFLLFNFSDILTSGSVLLGLNYGKKIIAPAIGCIKEIDDPNIIKFETGNIDMLKDILKNY